MASSIIRAWNYTWRDIWQPLRTYETSPPDIFMELFPELTRACSGYESMDQFYDAANDPALAELRFQQIGSQAFASDRLLIRFFEQAYFIIDDLGIDGLAAHYSVLLGAFFERYNLRFRVQQPFVITVEPGALFCSLVDEINNRVVLDQHLGRLNGSLRRQFDLLAREGNLPDVSRCIAQSSTFVEGLAGTMPGMRPGSLTDLVKQMSGTWPHVLVRDALSKLYSFCSDYPDIRHAGNPASQLRELELRDAVIIPMVFLAFSGYFVDVDFSELLCIRTHDVPDQLPVPENAVAPATL